MKTLLTIFSLSVLTFILNGCKKEMIQSAVPLSNSEDVVSDTKTVAKIVSVDKTVILTIRPNKVDGQDAFVDYKQSDPSYANGHSNTLNTLKAVTWTEENEPVYSRSFIKFDSLAIIPPTAKIQYAYLHLYGLPSGTAYLPQGNSIYPGSPYNGSGENQVFVRRVISSWDAKTVTWNTQPHYTRTDQDTIANSTSQFNYNVVINVTKLVSPMVSTPSKNYGFLLELLNEQYYRSMGFCSSDYSDHSKRPTLVIKYTE